MNISGLELNEVKTSRFCENAFCSSLNPVCFAGVSPRCERNRSLNEWHHFSFGEHVCHFCFEFLKSSSSGKQHCSHSSKSIWHRRMSAWQREWLRRSTKISYRINLSAYHYLAAQLLPWWIQCASCRRWRQLPPFTPIGRPDSPFLPTHFNCATVVKMHENPCSWPVDERVNLVQSRPHDFMASLQIHAWLQASPAFGELSSTYALDLLGLSPDALPGGGSKSVMGNHIHDEESQFKLSDEHFHLSLVEMQSWEHMVFPEMVRFPTLYLAVRNLVLCLWYRDPKRLLTSQLVSNFCFVRGLLRIVLCESWIPRILKELTYRGLINFGVVSVYPYPDSESVEANGCVNAEPAATERDKLRVWLFGRLEPSTAIATRQLFNGLILERECSGSQSRSPPDIRFQSLRSSHSSHWLSFFDQVVLNLPTPGVDMGDGLVGGDTLEGTETMAVNLPQNIWANRFYTYANHPLAIMAWQTDLPLCRLDDCCLLLAHNAGDRKTTVRVDPQLALRVQFHVEAVLGLVAQLNSKQQVENDRPEEDALPSTTGLTVQANWDRLDMETRKRLNDLTSSEEEKRLIEFYLASVEYDITEPLISSPVSCLSQSPAGSGHVTGEEEKGRETPVFPSARLDLLPTSLYGASQSADDLQRLEDRQRDASASLGNGTAAASVVSWQPCLLGGFSACRGGDDGDGDNWSALCSRLLADQSVGSSGLLNCSTPVTRIVVKGENKAVSNNSVPCLSPTRNKSPELVPPPLPSKTAQQGKKNIVVYFEDGTVEEIDWAIFPPSVKPDLVIDLSSDSISMVVDGAPANGCQTVRVHLPKDLLPLLVGHQQQQHPPSADLSMATETPAVPPARLISVTLVYPTAWWRALLRRVAAPSPACSVDPQATVIPQFSVLPASREERGFCHVFCDLFPGLDSLGIIRTQLFAVAADHWWSVADTLLCAAVDRHLRRHLSATVTVPPSNGDSGETTGAQAVDTETDCPGAPIQSHVDRHQHGDYEDVNTRLTLLLDDGTKSVSLSSSAGEELARQTGLLFMSNSSACCQPYTSCPSSMDALTASLSRGFQLAHGIRHLLPVEPTAAEWSTTVAGCKDKIGQSVSLAADGPVSNGLQ